MLKSTKKNRRGFTLMEVAIVTGVVGAIIGGIWVAASAVRQKNATTHAATEIGYIVNRIQSMAQINPASLYIGQETGCTGGIATITGNSLTANTGAGIFPQEMISGTTAAPIISSPWGQGDVGLVINTNASSCSGSGSTATYSPISYAGSFTLTYFSMPVSACQQMLLARAVGFANMGLNQICVADSGTTGGSCTSSTIMPSNAVTVVSETVAKNLCSESGSLSASSRVSVQLTFLTSAP